VKFPINPLDNKIAKRPKIDRENIEKK
jgi:hypothetical protein